MSKPAQKVRYAVIGTGEIADAHLQDFTSRPDVEVVGLSDPASISLARAAYKFPQAVASQDAEEMLREAQPDLVSICTPTRFHAGYAIAALQAGAHVACEKPLGMNLAEARAMEKARAKAKRLGLVNFSFRHNPAFRFARELIQRGELGAVRRVNAVYLQSWLGAPTDKFSWRHDVTLAGFGALGDLGLHVIDTLRFVTGEEFTRVIGLAQTQVPEKPDFTGKNKKVTTDTNASFLLQYKNETIATCEVTQVAPGFGNHFRLEISGTRGTLRVSSEAEKELQFYAGDALTHYPNWTTNLPVHSVPSGFILAQAPRSPGLLLDVARGLVQDYPTFQDGVKAQEVLEAIFKSMKTNAWVKI